MGMVGGLGFLVRAAVIFAVPAGELAALRHLAHRVLGPNLVILGFHSSDVLVPSAVALLVLLGLLERRGPWRLAFHPGRFAVNGVAVGISALAFLALERGGVGVGAPVVAVALLGAMIAALTAPFVVVDPKEALERIRSNSQPVAAVALSVAFLVAQPFVVSTFWEPFSVGTGFLVYKILHLAGVPVAYEMRESLILHHAYVSARILGPCSGLEGIFLFCFTYSLLLALGEGKEQSLRRWLVFVAGAIYMFLLNVVRITLFFLFAVAVGKSLGSQASRKLLVDLFHSGIGLGLYAAGIAVFFFLLNRVGRRQQAAGV